ncbi:MmgE/PrpD family protein [Ramlibacter sp.]|uniref:MmgE/PrpD family protein n=1 Tax=Ramlibacter sp. TaxID=1917967 RepID=UPI003D1021BB
MSEQLANYWSTARYEDLPPEIVELCKRSLLDTLVVGYRGGLCPEPRMVADAGGRFMKDTSGPSTVWGTSQQTVPALAARINGTASHALELDDFGGCGHSGACVVPAVAALADATNADGRTVIRAVAAGYDVAARVLEGAGGYRPHNERGWHSTGTCGTFGAAAAAAVMLELDAERTTWALGIAGSYASGTWAFLSDGAATKRFHPGMSASHGVEAACLADSGMSGPRDILEDGNGGFFKLFSGPEATPQATVQRLGSDFRIAGTGVKIYAACRGVHSPVEALMELLRDREVRTEDIARIVVHGAARTVRQFSNRRIANMLDAQFSLPYSMAVAALYREATLAQFNPPQHGDDVRALMDRVEVRGDTDMGPYDEPEVEVVLASGESIRRHVPIARGSYLRPVTPQELQRKHDTVAGRAMGDRLDRLRDAIGRLDTLESFEEISRLLRAE